MYQIPVEILQELINVYTNTVCYAKAQPLVDVVKAIVEKKASEEVKK